MSMYITLFMLAWVLSLVGYLWLAIVAFKRSIPWGLLVLLFSPISAIVFSLTNWFDARKAFLVYIIAFVLFFGSAVMIYGEVGMGNMQEIATRMQTGKLAPNQAYALIKKALTHTGASDLFADETSVASMDAGMPKQNPEQGISSPTPTNPDAAQVKGQKENTASKPVATAPAADKPATTTTPARTKSEPAEKTDKSETQTTPAKTSKDTAESAGTDTKAEKDTARIPVPEQALPDPLAQKPIKPKPNTIRMAMDKLPHYIGHYFIITLKTGTEQRGLLRKVESHQLILDRKLYGGNFRFKVSKREIKTIHMLTRLPDER
jgi:hypothetical protein